jgi:hypothetical protein
MPVAFDLSLAAGEGLRHYLPSAALSVRYFGSLRDDLETNFPDQLRH